MSDATLHYIPFGPAGIELVSSAKSQVLVQNIRGDARPYLHPVHTPRGKIITEDAPAHHPWQHGLYIGLNDVNGDGFWTEGKLAGRPRDGSVHVVGSGIEGESWFVDSAWRSPEGTTLLTDRQLWHQKFDDAMLRLDLKWTMTAAVDLTLGQYPYGGLFLRMPFRAGCNAEILSASGGKDLDAIEGQRAQWVRVSMQVDEAPVSVAILDHPTNFDHPTPWRADSEFGVGPAIQRTAALQIPKGDSLCYRYQILVTDGRLDGERIATAYQDFTEISV